MSDDIVIGVRGDVSGGRVIKRTLDDIAQSGNSATRSTDALEKQMRSLNGVAGTLRNAFVALGVGLALKGAIDASIRLQQLENRMVAATKSSADAARAFSFVRETADRLGLTFTDAADGFAGFSASALRAGLSFSETKKIFEDVATAAASLQLPAERVQLVFKALEQIAGKGTVQMEELKGQLGDALPGAFEIAAKAMGKTNAEFIKMVTNGEVLATDFLPKFSQAIKDELGGSAAAAAASLQASTNRLKTAFFDLQAEFAKSGIADTYRMVIDGIANVFKDPSFLKGIRDIGTGLHDIATQMVEDIRLLDKFFAITKGGETSKITDRIAELKSNPDGTGPNPFGINTAMRTSELSQLEKRLDRINKVGAAEKQIADSKISYERDMEKVRQFNEDKATKAAKEALARQSSNAGLTKAQQTAVKKQQNEITSAIKGSYTEEGRLTSEIANLERLKGFAKTNADVMALNVGIANTNKQLEEVRLKAELNGPIAKAFSSLAGEIDDGFKDAFKSAFTETDGGWRKLLAGWKATFKSFLADLAYQALVRPIVLSVVGGIGGSAGLSSSAVASVLGTSNGGSGILSSLGSIFNSGGSKGGGFNLSSLASAGSSVQSLLQGGSGFVNSLGGSFGFSTPAIGGIGPVAPGLFNGTTLSGFGAGAGIGGFAANLLGLGNKNGLVSAGAGLAGAAIGQALIPVPVLGAAIGSFAGTALSGLFGGGTPRQTISANYGLNSDGLLNVASVNTKGGSKGDAQSWGDSVATALNALATAVGGNFRDSFNIESNVGSKDKKTLLSKQKISGSAGDSQSIIDAIINGFDGLLQNANPQLLGVLQKSRGLTNDLDQNVADIGLAKLAYGIVDKTTDPLKQALEDVITQFDKLRERATLLGLPMEKLTEELAKQQDAATGAIKAMQAGFDSLESMKANFDAFLKGQQLGANSSLSPSEKLGIYQKDYGDLLSKAQGGDLSVTPQLLQAADALIAASRSFYASSTSFAGQESFIRSGITEIAKAAGVPGYATGTSSAASGMAWVGERGPELVNFRGGEQVYTAGQSAAMSESSARDTARANAQIVSILSEVLIELRSGKNATKAVASQLSRVASAAKVGAA